MHGLLLELISVSLVMHPWPATDISNHCWLSLIQFDVLIDQKCRQFTPVHEASFTTLGQLPSCPYLPTAGSAPFFLWQCDD